MNEVRNDFFTVISDFTRKIRNILRRDEQSRDSFEAAVMAVDERARLIRKRIAEQNETDYKRLLLK